MSKSEDLNTNFISQTLGYHGLPLQKVWEDERGTSDLRSLGCVNLDYSVYFARQKSLTFNDRTKRLRLHQFMCKKANLLFDGQLLESTTRRFVKGTNASGKTQTKK